MIGPLKNLLLQGCSIGLRYWFQLLLFRKLNFADIGELNIYLVFITFSTIIAGLEFHYLANRELVLSENRTIDALGFRLPAAFFITLVASLVYLALNGVPDYFYSVIMLLGVALAEYVNLELSRIQIACGRYITASLFGTFRAIGPYIAFVVPSPSVSDCLMSLLIVSLTSALIQYNIVRVLGRVQFKIGGFNSAKFAGLLPFFLTGALTAGGAFFERYAIKENISAGELGRYAVVFVFVTLNDTLINGLFLQPYYSRIIGDLSVPGKRLGMLAKMYLAAVSSVTIIFIFSLTFGHYLYDFLKKESPPVEYVICVLIAGLSKTLWSFLYYLYYANRVERVFSRHQLVFTLFTASIFYFVLMYSNNIQWGLLALSGGGFLIYANGLIRFKYISA